MKKLFSPRLKLIAPIVLFLLSVFFLCINTVLAAATSSSSFSKYDSFLNYALHEDKERAIEKLNTGSNEEILHSKKIVFTGGLSCGKTTTIKMLEKLGYSIAEESSESMINNFKHDFGHYPWEDKEKLFQFHQEVFLKQLEIEKNAKTKITFFDRGLPDRLAFMIFDGLQPTEEMMQMAKRNNYDKVIFFEGNNKCYELASHRPHNISDSVRAAQIIKKVYQDLGYDLLILPFCSKEERLQIILNEAL